MDVKIATCIKEANNWGRLEKGHKFDNKDFDEGLVSNDISPKLKELLQNIKKLDQEDMKTHKTLFKHFIYSDIKSSYGAKLIASVLASEGYSHAYSLQKTQRGMSFVFNENVLQSDNTTFATLTSTSFFEKPVGVNFRKEIIKRFNARPDNIYGQQIRIIILDSGFREGIDLFDVKYVHLMEPISTPADQKQAIGRATRRCGQKGLTFDRKNGWPLYVYRYETLVSEELKTYLTINDKTFKTTTTFFELFMKYSNIDPKKIALSNELENIGLDVAVDKELTSSIHSFDIKAMDTQSGGSYSVLRNKILKKYGHLKWPKVVVRNECISLQDENDVEEPFKNIARFTPTQEFIRTYFTPKYKNPGMLLWHSVGTGKTCTAIATASSTFEREGYTILYVTRHTLKASTWKDMFDNVCSLVVQDYVKKGMSIPEAHAARLRLISKGWFEPMSYRQFSNTLSNKNQYAKDLLERNGEEDILYKTLIIVDEAHKLFASDVEGSEKADIGVIKDALMHSNKVSGKNGAKILLMTATPYTTDVMDMFRLLNLCRPYDDQFSEVFEEFSEEYLDENGSFSKKSKSKLYNKLAGYISYLNQGKDIRTFSYPIITDINVPMSEYMFDIKLVDEINIIHLKLKTLADQIKNTGVQDAQQIKEQTKILTEKMNDTLLNLKEKQAECKMNEKLMIKSIKEKLKENLQKCDEDTKALIDKATIKYKADVTALKEASKNALKNASKEEKDALKEDYARQVKQLDFDLKYIIDQLKKRPEVQKCKADFTKQAEDALAIKSDRCANIEKESKEIKIKTKEEIKSIKEYFKSQLEYVKESFNTITKAKKELREKLDQSITNDTSQRMAIDKCLMPVMEPHYKNIINRDAVFDNEDMEEIVDEDETGKKNVYMILGHGYENVVDFTTRSKVPDDKVIVVFPVCSRPTYMNVGCAAIDMFSNPKYEKYLANPIKYRKKINEILDYPIRIYLPGEYIPEMRSDLFLKFEKENETVLLKSGVYRINNLPSIDREILPEPKHNLGSDQCIKWSGAIPSSYKYTTKIHAEVFKNNLFKPAKNDAKRYSELSLRSYNIVDVINTVGKGVYYYIGCRTSNIDIDNSDVNARYKNILSRSESQQKAPSREKKIRNLLENESIIESDKSVTSQPKKVSSKKSTPPPPPPKKRILRNTADEKAKINEIKELLSSEDANIDFNNLKQLLEGMTQTKTVQKLLHKLNKLEKTYKLKQDGEIKVKLVVNKLKMNGKSYSRINIGEFVDNKQVTQPKLYGILNNDTPVNDNKCTAAAIISQLKKLHRKNIMIKLPQTYSEADSLDVFNKVCAEIRQYL